MSAGQSLVTRGLVQQTVIVTVQEVKPLVANITVKLNDFNLTVALEEFNLAVERCDGS